MDTVLQKEQKQVAQLTGVNTIIDFTNINFSPKGYKQIHVKNIKICREALILSLVHNFCNCVSCFLLIIVCGFDASA